MKLADLPRNRYGIPIMPPSPGYLARNANGAMCKVIRARRYPTAEAAEAARQAEGGHHVYRCDRCGGGWHISDHATPPPTRRERRLQDRR